MKVLFVSRSKTGSPHAFVREQAEVLTENFEIEIDHFLISEGGLKGYFKAARRIAAYLKNHPVDLVHVHYGLSALPVVLGKIFRMHNKKMVITYHGSDINKSNERIVSLFASKFSSYNILVSNRMEQFFKKDYQVIPCGVDIDIDTNYRDLVRKEKGWGKNDFVILFSNSFERLEKDPDFAKKVVEEFRKKTSKNVHFLELKGYNRAQLTQLMQAADVMLMCSIMEGSPQIIKESILNSLPVLSNDVGEVKLICNEVDNCHIVDKTVEAYCEVLEQMAQEPHRIMNRQPLLAEYDNKVIAQKIFAIYQSV
ncbi:glycosyltransferase family 4 protein [Litoribacter ruber]|uniref:Glycosyltransferase family 4 protein n=1 Tax=Litoribacter ruber TaxID=702568 RepID=A0AAP2CKL9_9BACT|nr:MULTISPECIES: glycosyltransferase family 4 protein [Litoribacter]MBS9524265.1 glycosyltransferase family 4 protein [Litoribacter alkaliphilus]MBT0809937.1 glycosyltransferase family 4 protein [Litoribacter ruber]